MQFHKTNTDFFVPDGIDEAAALARTTHLCICAHPDDIEIMAYHGVAECFGLPDKWFTGVVASDGAGSPRSGIYGDYTDEQMKKVRVLEQRKAAYVGEYACQIQLGYPTSEVKNARETALVEDLTQIIFATRPEYVYLHNLADKHDTHVAVAMRTIDAIRTLPADARPARLYGCEVWRDLDWLPDADKVAFDLSAHENLQAALLGVFDSQICGGKRYDLATQGRRRAHATYASSHATDAAALLNYAMDLTPLVVDPSIDPAAFVAGFIDRFRSDVLDRLGRVLGSRP
jgi:LmbE family N-acetylglucosaminyl deacetylase